MRNHFMTFFLYLQYRPEQVVISLLYRFHQTLNRPR